MPPLRGIQNAGIRDPLPLQRKCVHTRCLFGLEQRWEGSRTPRFPALSTLLGSAYPSLLAQKPACPPVGLLMLRGAVRSAAGKGLGSLPAASSLFPFGVCLGFVHGSHPSTSRRSAAEGKRLSKFSRCRRHWETCLHGNRRVTSPNSIHRSIFLKNVEQASAMSAEPTGLSFVSF